MSKETTENSLRKNRIGVLGIVFFVVAASAPLVGMTGAAPVAMVIGNGAADLGVMTNDIDDAAIGGDFISVRIGKIGCINDQFAAIQFSIGRCA